MWTTVGHRWGYKSAGDVFCLYRRYRTKKGEEEKKRRRSKKLQLVISGPGYRTPSSGMTWDLKRTEEGKEGLQKEQCLKSPGRMWSVGLRKRTDSLCPFLHGRSSIYSLQLFSTGDRENLIRRLALHHDLLLKNVI